MAEEKILLMWWWKLCGKEENSAKENLEFQQLICEYGADKIMEAAVFLYAANDGTPTILQKKIREGTADKWLKQLPEIDETTRSDYEAVKACFKAEIAEVCHSKLAAHV